ncbi:MAG: nucleotidyltransferase domain-containing protein [Lachnospiraceae bacterium]|nr:nucleotidyltransferase domain-containing protein [Lachnospiraceae bacterium]
MCKLVEITTNHGGRCKVADIKKKYVLNIIQSASKCQAIQEIILFGSTTEERCTEDSDIDIAVFGDKTEYQMLSSNSYRHFTDAVYKYGDFQDYDILYFRYTKLPKADILKDIKKGYCIYKRRKEEVNG